MTFKNINDVTTEIFEIIKGFKVVNKLIIENIIMETKGIQKIVEEIKLKTDSDELDLSKLWAILNLENVRKMNYTRVFYKGECFFVANDGFAINNELVKLKNDEDWASLTMEVDFVNLDYVRFLENISFFIGIKRINITNWEWIKFRTPKELDIIYFNAKENDLKKIKMINIEPEDQSNQTIKFSYEKDIDYITIFLNPEKVFEYREQDIEQPHQYVLNTNEIFIAKKNIREIKNYLEK
ncbi:hypothetical protein [Clostridium thermobutyricum]|uniref:hypothetical protein n=1 Tax=Clostridium thermobutyricum TaxID=29372 RepID=UPI0018AB31CE|nr:hypothetical protein [Clostridium thermobutyricum]